MKIQRIEFKGFKSPYRSAAVDFAAGNVTVIYGENGCGKTTFLKAITAFLSQDDETLSGLGVEEIFCDSVEGEEVRRIHVKKNDFVFDWSELKESNLIYSRSLSLGVERGISTQPLKIEPEVIMEFLLNSKRSEELLGNQRSSMHRRKMLADFSEELSYFLKRRNAARYRVRKPEMESEVPHLNLQSIKMENIEELLLRRYRAARFAATKRIQSALFDTLSVAIDIENRSPVTKFPDDQRDFSSRLIENKARIIEALDDGEENNFKNRIVEILRKIEDERELNKVLDHNILHQLFKNILDELEFEKLLLESINLLVERFNSYLVAGKKLVVSASEVYVDIEGDRHTLHDLSSGERHILTFLALVLFEGRERNFLIIDEPEISLNIKWQRELLGLFSSFLPFSQIIVASHAPALAKRNPDYLSQLKVWRA